VVAAGIACLLVQVLDRLDLEVLAHPDGIEAASSAGAVLPFAGVVGGDQWPGWALGADPFEFFGVGGQPSPQRVV
jgi:hypothetical protein